MRKLIEKHLQKNGRGRGVILFSPEALAYILSLLNFMPGMNTTSNISVQQANQQARYLEKVDKDTKAGNKRIADKHAHRAIQERDLRRRTPNVDVTKGYSNGTILDADKVNLDKALSWYGLSNGLGLMTNVSDLMRNTPQFGNLMGLLYGDMAKVGLTTGLGAAIAPTLVPGGSFWTKGILWLNPSKYFGKGQYTTVLGGLNASLFGAAADAGLASYGAVEALLHFYNNPNLRNGTMAVLAGIPLVSTTRPILTAGLFEHYFNQGKFKTYKDLLKYSISEDNAKKLFELANGIKSKLGYFTSRNLKDKDFDLFKAITDNTESNLFGKKGANDAIKAAKKTPSLIEKEIRNKYEPLLDEINDRIRKLTLELYGEKTGGKTNFIDWLHDKKLGSDFLSSPVEEARFNGKKSIIVTDADGVKKEIFWDDSPFLERYYKNVIDWNKKDGFVELLIRSGKLSLDEKGRWIGIVDGEPRLVNAKLYVRSQRPNYILTGNRYTPVDLMPIHGSKVTGSSLFKQFRNPTENKSLFTVYDDGEAGGAMIERYSKRNKKGQIPFMLKDKRHQGPLMEVDKNAPEGYHESNHYNGGKSLSDHFDSNGGKAQEVKEVIDPTNPGPIINEYNYGKGTPDVKSFYNTLDDVPGAGPFAFLSPKYNYLNNYYS